MSEYTPTTDEVRTAWYQLTINVDSFDRWLAQVKAEAWDEGALWAAVECRAIENENEVWITSGDNPYREEVTE